MALQDFWWFAWDVSADKGRREGDGFVWSLKLSGRHLLLVESIVGSLKSVKTGLANSNYMYTEATFLYGRRW